LQLLFLLGGGAVEDLDEGAGAVQLACESVA
jgi:hypothetical protein